MKLIQSCIVAFLVVWNVILHSHPFIRSIHNQTPFQFMIAKHYGVSDCSLNYKEKEFLIQPFSTWNQVLLLGSEKPGLLLRPSAFYDEHEKKLYAFLDERKQIDIDKLKIAFDAWKKVYDPWYKKSMQTWFAQWVCGDISLIHNHAEFFGYLLNVSIARVDNEKHYHTCMVDYSEGLFSRQVIDITITFKRKNGIIPKVKSFVGQGGLCQDEKIVLM